MQRFYYEGAHLLTLFFQIWDMRTKACVHTLTGHTNTVAEVRCQSAEPQVYVCFSQLLQLIAILPEDINSKPS